MPPCIPNAPIVLTPAARIKIKTREIPPHHSHKGQDVEVTVVLPDGTEHPIHGVVSVTWTVSNRRGYAQATLVAEGVEIDVTGIAAPHLTAFMMERDRLNALLVETDRHLTEAEKENEEHYERREKLHEERGRLLALVNKMRTSKAEGIADGQPLTMAEALEMVPLP